MKKTHLLYGTGLLFSVLGCFLRNYQMSQVKNQDTLLFASFALETLFLMGLLVIAHVVIAFLVLGDARTFPNYEYTVYCSEIGFLAVTVLAGFLLVLSFFIGIMDVKNGYDIFQASAPHEASFPFPWLDLFELSLVAVTGFVLAWLGKNAFDGSVLTERWVTVLPVFTGIVYFYQVFNELTIAPALQEKLYPILGGLSLIHGLYALSTSGIKQPSPRKIAFFSSTSLVFFCTNLSTLSSVYDAMVTLGLHLYLVAFGYGVIKNTYCSQREYTPPEFQ